MKEKLLIVGAGGHARSVIDIALENNDYEIVGCLDSVFSERTSIELMEDIPVVGTDKDLQKFYDAGIHNIFIAIGSNKIRDDLFDRAVETGFTPVNIISRNAKISARIKLGQGICIMAGAVVNVNSVIGNNCIINSNSSIDHDCIIGKSVHIAPGVTLSGYVKVGDGTQIGTGASIIDKISIGKNCFIGCGSAVVRDTEDNILAYGIPARKIRKLVEEFNL